MSENSKFRERESENSKFRERAEHLRSHHSFAPLPPSLNHTHKPTYVLFFNALLLALP